jgi:hypothetical protein
VIFGGVSDDSNIDGDFISILKEEVSNFKDYQIDASLGDVDHVVGNLLDVSVFVVSFVTLGIVVVGAVVVEVCSWCVLS